jgi:hypothetical protein
MCKDSVQLAIKEAVQLGYLETSTIDKRKRRKLKLSVLLRSPIVDTTQQLSFPVAQPVLKNRTDIVLPSRTVNSKENNKLNNNTGSNFFRNERTDESYLKNAFDGEGYKKLRAKIEQLRAGRKTP